LGFSALCFVRPRSALVALKGFMGLAVGCLDDREEPQESPETVQSASATPGQQQDAQVASELGAPASPKHGGEDVGGKVGIASALAPQSSMVTQSGGKMQEDGPLSYRCSQGILFAKRSEDPESKKIVKLKKPVGTFIYSTGYTWTGPGGGVWAELDAAKGEMGWMLVRGPGFGLNGPALIDAYELAEATSVQVVLSEEATGTTAILFESFVSRDTTILDVKKMLAQATSLTQRFCCLIKDLPAKIPGSSDRLTTDYCEDLKDKVTIGSLGCGDTTQLHLMYLADFPAGFQMPKRLEVNEEKGGGYK